MKKTLVVTLILILILSLSACGSSNDKNGSGGKSDINIVDKPSNNNQKSDNTDDSNDYDYPDDNGNDYDSSDDDYEDSDDNVEVIYQYFNVDPSTDFFFMDTSLLGVSYSDFTKKLSYCELTPIEDWPWWGKNTEVVYATYDENTFCCLFQNRKLVVVYRDSNNDKQGKKYSTAVDYYGNPSSETEYWSGSPEYTWNMDGCHYQQHVEIYSEGDGHYRQQYVSNSFVE